MSKTLNTPILLIGFNRPDLTKQVLNQIRKVKPKKLYFSVDGPRQNNQNDLQMNNELKKLILTIDWDCTVKTNFLESNNGCKLGPLKAIEWLFKNEEYAIILEDDILPEESFFYYCEELLVKYKDDSRIGTISGNNFTHIASEPYSYLFSKYSQTWGWATWRRVWEKYDINISTWPQKKKEKWLKSFLKNKKTSFYWKLIFNAVYNNEISTAWDYQWTYMSWTNNFLTIIPGRNLATNIGIGVENATHTKMKGKLFQYPKYEMKFPLKHPEMIESNQVLDTTIQKNGYILWKEMAMNLIRKWRKFKNK